MEPSTSPNPAPAQRRPELLIAISRGTHDDDELAEVRLDGNVCAATVAQVCEALDRVAAAGAKRISVDLSRVVLCTSHGFDAFDRLHRSLSAAGGHLELHGATGGVARCLETLRELDPSFLRRPSA